MVGLAEDAVHHLVTLLLFGVAVAVAVEVAVAVAVAVAVLYRTGRALFDSQLPFPECG